MEIIIALLTAALAGLVTYRLWPLPAGQFDDRVAAGFEAPAPDRRPLYRELLAGLAPLARYTPAGWARAIAGQVYWCQLTGKWAGWSAAEVSALHLALLIAGALAGLLVARDNAALAAGYALAGPLLLNLIYLRAPARRVRRQLAAELPEFVSILAAEAASETTLQEALTRLARGRGVCAAWFQQALRLAVGRSLFTEGGQPGALALEARASGERDLITLARTLDNVKRRGTGTRELLAQTARDTAARFTGEAQLRAEKVGSEIILPMILFFFLPYIVVILSVLAGPLLTGGLF